MAQQSLVCIVDDDVWVRTGLENLVRSLGYCACTFESVEAFTRSERACEAACVIADLNMPGLGGLALQRILRSEGRTTPLILISAQAHEGDRAMAFAQGVACFLPKPLDERQLIDRLASLIEPDAARNSTKCASH
jgi:FixJ family two-component response regulator